MKSGVVCDDRGRILLPKDLREEYGEKFIIAKAPGEVVLIPVPKDPLKDLRELGKKLPKDMSVADLKKLARELALKEVLEEEKEREQLRKKLQKKR